MKTEKIKAADVKLFSLFNSRSNLTAFQIARLFSSSSKISALLEQFQVKTQRDLQVWGEKE